MADRYGWTPDQVSRLTIPQIRMYLDIEQSPKDKRNIIQFRGHDALAQYSNWKRRLNAGA